MKKALSYLIPALFVVLTITLGIASAHAETGAIPGTAPLPAGPQAIPTVGGSADNITPPAPLSISDAAAGSIFGAYAHSKTMFTAAQNNATGLSDAAKSTMGALAFLMFAWIGVRAALTGTGGHHGPITMVIEAFLEVGIFFFLLDQYSWWTGTVIDSMEYVAGMVSGGDQTAASGATIMLQSGVAELNAIGAIANMGLCVVDVREAR